MLSLAKAHKDYYLQKVGEISPREDYYLRGGTATGHWHGSGAAEMGLEGAVSAEVWCGSSTGSIRQRGSSWDGSFARTGWRPGT